MTNAPIITMVPPRPSASARCHAPWSTDAVWQQLAQDLARGDLTLLSLWADARRGPHGAPGAGTHQVGIAQPRAVRGGSRRSASCTRRPNGSSAPPRDLFGLVPQGAPDARPWLDHGRWGMTHPLGAATPGPQAAPYPFLPVERREPAPGPGRPGPRRHHRARPFPLHRQGETVVRLEERLGYVHKGIDDLMHGATLDARRGLAGRISGDSTVAYALGVRAAPRGGARREAPAARLWLRALMAELERLANHLGDIGAICNDAAFAMMLAQCSVLRERVLRTADACFGHRFMRDRIVPGGVARRPGPAGEAALRALLVEIRAALPDPRRALRQHRVTAGPHGRHRPAQDRARRAVLAPGALSAAPRAATSTPGATFAYAPYDRLAFDGADCAPTATSTRGSGSALTRSSRACR